MLGAFAVFAIGYALLLLGVAEFLGSNAVTSAIVFGAFPFLCLLFLHEDSLLYAFGLVSVRTLEEAVDRAKEEARLHGGNNTSDEGMEWANLLIKELWPHIAKYTEDLMHSFEPTLQETLHVPIRFRNCSLGRQPIRLGPIKAQVIGGYVDGVYRERAGLELQVGVEYKSDVDVVLSTMVASLGVANLDVTGTLSVLLRPFLDKAPFIGGLEIVFTNAPQVQIDFTGLANIADLPGVHGAVRHVINDIIAKKLVIPHRIAVPISGDHKAVDLARLKNPTPAGVLRLEVVSAQNLAAADVAFFSQATSDPYVQVQVGGETWQTPVIKKSCNPRWTKENKHDFVVYSVGQSVQVHVWDWDKFTSHDSLGEFTFTVDHLVAFAGKGTQAFELFKTPTDAPADPKLYMKVEWYWLDQNLELPSAVEEGNGYLATVKIDECSGLQQRPDWHPPYSVRVRVRGDTDAKRSLTTSRGYAVMPKKLKLEDLDHIRQLSDEGLSAHVVALTLGMDEAFVSEYLAGQSVSARASVPFMCRTLIGRASARKEKQDRQILESLQARRRAVGTACNPHFEEVLTIPIAHKSEVLVVELLCDPSKRKRGQDGVLGRFEVQLGQEVVEGPFSFKDPSTGESLQESPHAKLCGNVTLWRLRHSEDRSMAKLRGVAKLWGLHTVIGTPHHSGRATSAHDNRPRPSVGKRKSDRACFPFLGSLW
mmetsp:Transcript_6266/g.14995  ORF Transcript_6266/g.14995 Transcript_6266/m.14995 type:complete len:706 (+) Transcript_6266:86-2203(+)